MNSQKVEAILARIFLALITFIVTFLILDTISVRFIDSRAPIERQFPVQNTRNPQPYTMFGGLPNSEDLNELGYRGLVPIMPKPADEYRIFMLGGSTVFLGDPPITILLEETFAQNGKDHVRVYNFGVVSSVSTMELTRIVTEISELSPDLIIMYNGGNDIVQGRAWDPRPGYPFNYVVYENNPLLESDLDDYPALALFAYGSNLLRVFLQPYFIQKFVPLEELREATNWKSPEWENEIASTYVRNLVKADKVAHAFDADFIAFFQPLVYYKNTLTAEEAIQGDNRTGVVDYAQTMRQKIRTKITQAQAEAEIHIVDLSNIYEAETAWVFTDYIHTRQESKSVVVEVMYQNLIALFDFTK